jgi:hypothetical protein
MTSLAPIVDGIYKCNVIERSPVTESYQIPNADTDEKEGGQDI